MLWASLSEWTETDAVGGLVRVGPRQMPWAIIAIQRLVMGNVFEADVEVPVTFMGLSEEGKSKLTLSPIMQVVAVHFSPNLHQH